MIPFCHSSHSRLRAQADVQQWHHHQSQLARQVPQQEGVYVGYLQHPWASGKAGKIPLGTLYGHPARRYQVTICFCHLQRLV